MPIENKTGTVLKSHTSMDSTNMDNESPNLIKSRSQQFLSKIQTTEKA